MAGKPNKTSSSKSETTAEVLILDQALYRMRNQWPIDQSLMAGKRDELRKLLREVGSKRFAVAVDECLSDYQGEFCPTIAMVRRYVPSTQEGITRHVCPLCMNGWVYSEYRDSAGNRQVERCPNFRDPQYRRSAQAVHHA